MKRIVFTGGGSAGHVTPNIALFPKLKSMGYDIHYIGSYDGIEKKLIEDYRIPYYGISTGKLRRYFDIKNFSDPFRVLKGFAEAKKILKTLKPDIVFSKGGFVSVPVVRAAAMLKIPCIIHESDMTPGLANSMCIPVAQKICCNFPETLQNLPAEKAILTGSPIRTELTKGSKDKGLAMCGFNSAKPVIKLVREALPKLLEDFQIVHICGKDKIDNLLLNTEGYKQFEFVKDDLKDLFAMADIVISRAGANAICELLTLRKPNLLIPLPAHASRGDQILNAKSFESQGFSMVADEDYLTSVTLTEKVHELYFTRQSYIDAMQNSKVKDSTDTIIALIEDTIKKKSEK